MTVCVDFNIPTHLIDAGKQQVKQTTQATWEVYTTVVTWAVMVTHVVMKQ